MGTCFSSFCGHETHDSDPLLPTAKVVSVNGVLSEYNVPVLASQILQSENSSSTSSPFFLCNSDGLYYDDYIPALDSEDELQPNQIYFLLPLSQLQHPLSASDMAALAVKASVALQKASKKKGGFKRSKTQISPVFEVLNEKVSNAEINGLKKTSYARPNPVGISRSGSVRRLQRYTSRRAKMAVRSFRLRLSTINEGTVL